MTGVIEERFWERAEGRWGPTMSATFEILKLAYSFLLAQNVSPLTLLAK